MSNRGGGRGSGSDLDVELCVVGIAMELYSMPAYDMTEGKHVNGEEGWTKNRAMGDSTGNSVVAGLGITQGYELSPSSEV